MAARMAPRIRAGSTDLLHPCCTASREPRKNSGETSLVTVRFEGWPDDGQPTNGELALGEFGGK
jgi:hypothetical protein